METRHEKTLSIPLIIVLHLLNLSYLDPCYAGTFLQTGSMADTRLFSASTLLPDGRVLIAGGKNEDQGFNAHSLSSAELFDPTSESWTTTTALHTARHYHTMTVLTDGKVLAVGGYNDDGTFGHIVALSSAEIYDPITSSWSIISSMNEKRARHGATLLPDGKVLVTGGSTNEQFAARLSSAEIYDPVTGKWTEVATMHIDRASHTATLLANGQVLVVGGLSSRGIQQTSELYDPSTGAWSTLSFLSEARTGPTATLLQNGKVLSAGGGNSTARGGILASAELYDPATHSWTPTAPMQLPHAGHSATLLPSGKVLIAGGSGASAELYDPSTSSWTSTGVMVMESISHAATLMRNGKVLIAGGLSDSGAAAASQIYDDALASPWTSSGSLAVSFTRHTATPLTNGNVLIVGGQNTGGGQAAMYDPVSGTWSQAGFPLSARYGHTATLLTDGKVLVTGGYGSLSVLSSAELFDPKTMKWVKTSVMTTKRASHAAVLLNNGNVLVVGGGDTTSAEIYDPTTQTWTPTGLMPAQAFTQAAFLLSNGKVLALGNAIAEVYDPVNAKWDASGSGFTTTASYSYTITLLNSGVFLIAGGYYYNQSDPVNSGPIDGAKLYNPITGVTSQTGSLPIAVEGHTATLLSNGGVLIVGEGKDRYNHRTQLYDPNTGAWTISGSTGVGLPGHTATLLSNGNVLVVGNVYSKLFNPSLASNIQTNIPPAVTITAPLPNTTLPYGTNVMIMATAFDSDGSITNVSFFSGTNLIGQTYTMPYSLIWSNVTGGTYSLTARATDNQGATIVSTIVQITVEGGANSVADFSMVQGSNNWFYGYCQGAYSENGFIQFTNTANCCGNGDYWWTGRNVWTSMWQYGGHPNGLNGNQGHDRILEFAVRRWVSTVAGTVTISGDISNCDSPGVSCNGGSTALSIVIDGTNQVFTAASSDTAYSVQATVTRGSIVDFLIDSQGVDVNDGTLFTAKIQQAGPINLPPSILSQPQSQAVNAGAIAVLSVTATGTPPLQYQWRKNGADIPGATNATISIANAQAADGGIYTVSVANGIGVIESSGGRLTVQSATVQPGDNLVDRIALTGASGTVNGSNTLATIEVGEPLHAGQPGGHSVWYRWVAPAAGVASFDTRGSSFDTLLAVYTGASVAQLTLVAADDDSGGFFTSAVSFNATAGTEYEIAIDGFGGESGDCVLNWSLQTGVPPIPVIVAVPRSQAVVQGGNATFSVTATGGTLGYQWFFNGQLVPGATASNYIVVNAQPANAGSYSVQVTLGANTVASVPVRLDLTASVAPGAPTPPTVLTQDKLEDLAPLNSLPIGLQGFHEQGGPLARGYTARYFFSTQNATRQAGEPNPCGVVGGASQWFALTNGVAGQCTLRTAGSSFDTVLAVYTLAAGQPLHVTNLVPEACDAHGTNSVVQFTAKSGVTYYVDVDGVNGAKGSVQLAVDFAATDLPAQLSNALFTLSGRFRFHVTGKPGATQRIDGTSDLHLWTPLWRTNTASGEFDFEDVDSPTLQLRLYRSVQE